MRWSVLASVIAPLLVPLNAGAEDCRPSLISVGESRQLLRLIPDVVAASAAHAAVTIIYEPKADQPQVASFSIWVKSGAVPTALDNGLIGYFSVDRKSALVENVAYETIDGDAEFRKLQKQIRRRHCLTLVGADAP